MIEFNKEFKLNIQNPFGPANIFPNTVTNGATHNTLYGKGCTHV